MIMILILIPPSRIPTTYNNPPVVISSNPCVLSGKPPQPHHLKIIPIFTMLVFLTLCSFPSAKIETPDVKGAFIFLQAIKPNTIAIIMVAVPMTVPIIWVVVILEELGDVGLVEIEAEDVAGTKVVMGVAVNGVLPGYRTVPYWCRGSGGEFPLTLWDSSETRLSLTGYRIPSLLKFRYRLHVAATIQDTAVEGWSYFVSSWSSRAYMRQKREYTISALVRQASQLPMLYSSIP
jgi:hypothetical protein